MLGSLFNKVASSDEQLFKKETLTQVFPVYIAKFLRTAFYIACLVAAPDSLTTVQVSQLGCLFFGLAPPCDFDYLDQKLTQNVPQTILYYHVTKQFLINGPQVQRFVQEILPVLQSWADQNEKEIDIFDQHLEKTL